VIDLADARSEIAAASEHLRQRYDVWQNRSKVRLQVMDAGRVRPEAGQERDPARTAQRELRVRAVEPDSARGQPIDIWTLHQLVAVRSQVVVEIVGHDEEHVRPRWLLRDDRLR
jgi:NADPH-dependent ferric siderophore reductase